MMKNKLLALVLVSFVGLASYANAKNIPVITNVPAIVSARESITITGSNLKVDGMATRVRISWPPGPETFENSLLIGALEATSITATMPDLDYDGNMGITVSVDDTSAVKIIQYKSKLHIESIVPEPEQTSDMVVISGKKFMRKDVAGATVPATIIMSWTESGVNYSVSLQATPKDDSSIVFQLPAIEYAGDISLMIKIGEKVSNELFVTIKALSSKKAPVAAVISKIEPPVPTSGETITIVGDNFNKEKGAEVILKYKSDRGDETLTGVATAENANLLKYNLPKDFEPGGKIALSVRNKGAAESGAQQIKVKGNMVNFDFRVGFQTSTIKKSSSISTATDGNNKLFHDNRLFYDITATMRVCPNFDLQTRLNLGRTLVEAVKANSQDHNIEEIVKNAESAEGELSLYSKITHHDKYTGFYVRPAFAFLATTDSEVEDDLFFEKIIATGYEPQVGSTSKFKGSKLELGYKYSDAFNHEERFISLLRLAYNIKGFNPAPFIDAKVNAGKGSDDLSVLYGVNLDIDPLFESVYKLFVQEASQ